MTWVTTHYLPLPNKPRKLLLISDSQNIKNGLLILQHLTQECICRIRRIWNAVCTTSVIHVHWAIIPYQVKAANTLLTASQSNNKKRHQITVAVEVNNSNQLVISRNSIKLGQLPAAFLITLYFLFKRKAQNKYCCCCSCYCCHQQPLQVVDRTFHT